MASEKRTRAPGALFAAAVLAAFAVLVALGLWQVQRLHWKEGLIATIASRMAAAPVPLAEILHASRAGEEIEYRPVTAIGVFDHARERHFFATHKGRSGFYVYTPLATEAGDLLFVNRGFVPYDLKDPATRPESQPEGRQTVTGLARSAPAEKPSFIVPDNDAGGNIFYWKDLSAMAASAGLSPDKVLPFFVDAGPSPSGTLPEGGVTIIDQPNNHLQYALTWFGLAAALAVVAGVYARGRRLRSPREP